MYNLVRTAKPTIFLRRYARRNYRWSPVPVPRIKRGVYILTATPLCLMLPNSPGDKNFSGFQSRLWSLGCFYTPETMQMMLGPWQPRASEWRGHGAMVHKNTTLVHCVVRKIGASQTGLRDPTHGNQKIDTHPRAALPFYISIKQRYHFLYKSWNRLFLTFLQVGLNHVVDQQTLLVAFFEEYLDRYDVSK